MNNSKCEEAVDPKFGAGVADSNASRSLMPGLYLCLLLGLAVLFFHGMQPWQGFSFYFRDICLEIVPKRTFWVDEGGFVLWNPHVFYGMPFAANLQSQAFYPLNCIYFLAPVYRSLDYFILIHFWVAGILTWLMLGEAGIGKTGRFAGALVFCFGGFIVSSGLQIVNLGSSVWLPGLVWLFLRSLRRNLFWNSLGLGLVLTVQFLGGEPMVVYMSIMMLIIIGGFFVICGALERGRMELLKRTAFSLGFACFIFAVLSAFQWMPALEMSRLSNRSAGIGIAEATIWSFGPRDLIQLVVPHHFLDESHSESWGFGIWSERSPYIMSIYCGAAGLILMIFALRSSYRKHAVFWWLFLAFWLILSLGQSGLLYTTAFKLLPGFDRFRIPQRCTLGVALASSWLAAIGMEWLREFFSGASKKRVPFYMPVFIILVVIVLGFLLARPCNYSSQDFLFYRSLLRTLLFVSLLFLCIWSYGYIGPAKRAVPFIVVGIIFMDLFVVHRNLNPLIKESFYESVPSAALKLKRSGVSPPRVFVSRPLEKADRFVARNEKPEEHYRIQREWLQPFTALSCGINDVWAHSSFYLGYVDELSGLINDCAPEKLFRFLSRSAAAWLFMPMSGGEAGMREVPDPLPRAMVLYDTRVIPERKDLLDAWLSESFNPRELLLLEEDAGFTSESGHPSGHAARIIEYSNERVVAAAEARAPGWLLLLDTYYPGWEARLDGEPAKIYRADGFFRAVMLGAGGHRVEFIYHPRSFYAGAKISLTGGVLLFAAAAVIMLRKRKNR